MLRGLTQGQEGRAMFVEFHGRRETGPGLGVGALEVRRAAVETAGCRERFDQREWVATGNEPSWRLDITARDLLMNVPGGAPGQRTAHGGLRHDGGSIVYATTEGAELRVKSTSGAVWIHRPGRCSPIALKCKARVNRSPDVRRTIRPCLRHDRVTGEGT